MKANILAVLLTGLTIACSGGSTPTAPTPVVVVTPPVPTANPLLQDPQFSLAFYREFVRNGFEQPNALQPLQRWVQNPHINIRTVRDDGTPVDPTMIALVASVARAVVPQWTGGLFQVTEVQQGVNTMPTAEWINVDWPGIASTVCGSTPVGGNVVFLYVPSSAGVCGCGGTGALEARTVAHEFGHALGYWHTDSPSDVMYAQQTASCDLPLSSREAFHARVAYSEPVGSTDPK